MLSDEWLRQGVQHGELIKVTDIVDYVIWADNKNVIIGVSVNFEEADDYHYDIEIEEWMKFLDHVLKNQDLKETSKLFRDFLDGKSGMFAFQDALDTSQIKYDKIAFW
jgi:hypothetical protein